MDRYDYLIVGAGLYGAFFAHMATSQGKRCLVVDRRQHAGGNLYCSRMGEIDVHSYGPHIFHTSSEKVWKKVNSIVRFHPFINSPIAQFNGERYNLPFNMNTFHQLWGVSTASEARVIIDRQKSEATERMRQEGATEPRNLEEQALILVGRDIYEKLIKGYTEKQWGRKCRELPASIIRRLPVRFTYDNNYFNDTYQGIPDGGYNRLIDGLLRGCDVMTGVDFIKERGVLRSKADKVLFTGCIDEYYEYKYGKLDYRTVRFETETIHVPDFQHNAVVNFTDSSTPYTRIVEHKHFCPEIPVESIPYTVISREYSTEWDMGAEPFYPIADTRNTELYNRYREDAVHEDNVIFGGRLAEYRYYDMAPIVEKILSIDHF